LRSDKPTKPQVSTRRFWGSTALALKADNASAGELQNAVGKAVDSLGRLDIFVSNAGILTRGTIDCFSIDEFDRMVAVNIRGAFIGIQAASKINEAGDFHHIPQPLRRPV
jgi:3-oxoacyl-[acyl-carrier protein] reductase